MFLAAVNDPTLGSPGLAGFLVTFALAIATWLLIRSMVGRLRKVRYGPDPSNPDGADRTGDGAPGGAAADDAGTGGAETSNAGAGPTAVDKAAADRAAAKDAGPGA